jgi:hypothetical protein
MGKRFSACLSLATTKKLSLDVEKAVMHSFRCLLEKIKTDLPNISKEVSLAPNMLPIRPIILGGDDITFVCDGRLGIYFAQLFIEEFEKCSVNDGEKLTACGGVAITKLKFPFFRGYRLAEELCANAKMKRKEKKDDGSWIDFQLANGTLAGSLSEIRASYQVSQGSLLFRPYKIIKTKSDFSFSTLCENTATLFQCNKEGKQMFPNAKIKDLREILSLGEGPAAEFVKEMEARGLKLPVKAWNIPPGKLFVNRQTPYFDMIELSELFPKFVLLKGGN